MISALLFSATLWLAYDVPLPYGYAVHRAALSEGVNPFDVGALLMAENKSRKFRPWTVGRYGATAGTPRAERGLFQLAPYWASECGVKRADLFDPFVNIHCAVVAVRKMQDKTTSRGGFKRRKRRAREIREGWGWADRFDEHAGDFEALEAFVSISLASRPDWRTHYRCHPKHRASPGCKRSVARVVRLQRMLHRTWDKRGEARFWIVLAGRLGPALVRSLPALWYRAASPKTGRARPRRAL